MTAPPTKISPFAVFTIFLRLGLTSFGGPVAHIGFFRDEFVQRRRWLEEARFADFVALCQFLPGPGSSQLGLAIGLTRGGFAGAFAAWLGFTLPSAVLLMLFAMGVSKWGEVLPDGLLHGLKLVAVAVVAKAVWGMATKLCSDVTRKTLAVFSASLVLLWPTAIGQVVVIAIAAVLGTFLFRENTETSDETKPTATSSRLVILPILAFLIFLVGLPLLARTFSDPTLGLVDTFYRTGSLVFGGGHVVLPLLQAEVVPSGLVSEDAFMAGYGAAQAVPGPLFTFAAFLGASMSEPGGWGGGLLCLLAIYLPSFLLVIGVLPLWEQLRHNRLTRSALGGVNAAVVGLLLAALYHPVWTSAITRPVDFAQASIAFAALMYWQAPPWLVVLCSGLCGALIQILL